MSCNRCANQARATMGAAGVPPGQVQATWANSGGPEQCPACGAFLSRDGVCIAITCTKAIPGWRAEKRGVLPFAAKYSQREYAYNLVGKSSARHFLYRLAVESPGEKVVRYREDDGREYEYWTIYNEERHEMRTNISACPHRATHHLYATCSTCGRLG